MRERSRCASRSRTTVACRSITGRSTTCAAWCTRSTSLKARRRDMSAAASRRVRHRRRALQRATLPHAARAAAPRDRARRERRDDRVSSRSRICSRSSWATFATSTTSRRPTAQGAPRDRMTRSASAPMHNDLLADFDAGKKAALARAVSIVENHRPGFERLLATLSPATRARAPHRHHRAAGRGEEHAHHGARRGVSRDGPDGRRRRRRSDVAVHGRRAARRSHSHGIGRARSRRLHSIDGDARLARRPRRGDARSRRRARRVRH